MLQNHLSHFSGNNTEKKIMGIKLLLCVYVSTGAIIEKRLRIPLELEFQAVVL